jgi:hypothetical protein
MIKKHRVFKILCISIISLITVFLGSSHISIPITDLGISSTETAVFSTGVPENNQDDDLPGSVKPAASSTLYNADTSLIIDMKNWEHPAKDIFIKYKIEVKSLQLLKDGTYPIFSVSFPKALTNENESYFNEAISEIAKANLFWDFELVDDIRAVRINVSCDRQFNMVDDITINGDANYFVRLSQKAAVSDYIYILPLSIKADNKLVELLVKGKWKYDSLTERLGKADSSFDGYDMFFDEGISVKSGKDSVYNIIFNSKYTGNVINNIGMKSSKPYILKSLGAPHFENRKEHVFGYKGKDFYIFFMGEERISEISVYRRDTIYSKDSLKKLLEKHKADDDGTVVYKMVEELLKDWPAYDLYYNERGGVGVSYDSIGINIDNLYADRGGPYITVFGNFEGDISSEVTLPAQLELLKDFSNDMVLLKLDTDRIFEMELDRQRQAGHIEELRKQGGVLSPDGTKRIMDNEGGTYEHAGLFLCYVNKDKPDVEIKTAHFPGNINWLDNRFIIFSVSMNGIYIYDSLKNKTLEIAVSKLESGLDYELVSAENGQIVYKNINDGKVYTCTYHFSKDGELQLDS